MKDFSWEEFHYLARDGTGNEFSHTIRLHIIEPFQLLSGEDIIRKSVSVKLVGIFG